ncbi:MAG: nicotinate (nicotinamide) nucleotide adenylyltransferase [Clostridia bacterium]|nr:nicotinate (nicotinamide) nucleotide adenylyltransferase [Clostridia bacterium]
MKIAVFGGAFNPVHKGHIKIVEQLNESFCFDKILIVPTKFSPHKSNDVLESDSDRLNMCKLAFCGMKNVEVSDVEIKRNKISYTVDTLNELKTIYPFDELFLVCGSDMFLSLLNWRCPQEIFEKASILAFRRNSENVEAMENYKTKLEENGAKVEICTVDIPPYSSTDVRSAIKSDSDYSEFLDSKVFEYINERKLYV